MNEFLKQYIETAIWASHPINEAGKEEPSFEHQNFNADDLAPETLAEMKEDCKAFQKDNATDLATRSDEGAGGHDFWLTRNGHGAGFWDGDWENDVGQRLTEAARIYGTSDLYLGDDGKLYLHG